MSHLEIIIIAFALALDAFAVAVAAGVTLPEVGRRRTLRLSFHFGLFQALFAILGWAAGASIRYLIGGLGHWLAFSLLLLIGLNMIRQAFKDDDSPVRTIDPTKGLTMVFLSVATSIDAFAVGASFSLIDITIWYPALVIGLVAALMTSIGMRLGQVIGKQTGMRRWAEATGGLVLIAIGFKILLQL